MNSAKCWKLRLESDSPKVVKRIGADNQQERPQVPRKNSFDATATPEMGYLIGALLSDGSAWMHIHSKRDTREFRMQFEQIDREMIEHIAKCIKAVTGRDYPIREFVLDGRQTSWRLLVYGNDFIEWMLQETKNKIRVPGFWKTTNEDFRKALVAGLIDGDGWIQEKKTKAGSPIWYMGCVTADPWLDDLAEVLASIGVGVYPKDKNRVSTSGRIVWGHRIRMQEFCDAGCYLIIRRKQERLDRFRQWNLQRLDAEPPRLG